MKLALTLLAVGSLAPTAAEACRVNLPPHVRMMGDFDGVVVGVVENPRQGLQTGERPAWDAIVRVTRVVEGHDRLTRYPIGRTGQSADCDDGQLMPAAGEVWVVYLRDLSDDRSDSTISYPLALARREDVRFRSQQSTR